MRYIKRDHLYNLLTHQSSHVSRMMQTFGIGGSFVSGYKKMSIMAFPYTRYMISTREKIGPYTPESSVCSLRKQIYLN